VLALTAGGPSRYRLRRTRRDAALSTAEAAASCLRLAGDDAAAAALDGWLDTYVGLSMRLRGRS
jgi:DTW domain-containing protein YfiP